MRVGVAMATHQGEQFLAGQLASISAQTRLPDLLQVCDDGSTDGSLDVVEAFAVNAPFPVRVETSSARLGAAGAFERAVRVIDDDVELIVLCDQDDVWLPRKLERLVAAFAVDPAVLLAFSDAFLIDDRGARLPGTRWDVPGFHAGRRRRVREDPFGQLVNHYLVSGCTLAFRAELRGLLLPFPDELSFRGSDLSVLHDTWITMVLSLMGRVAVIDEPLIEYRVHDAQAVGITRRTLLRRMAPQEVRWRVVGRRARGRLDHLAGLADLAEVIETRLLAMDELPGRDAAVRDVRAAIAHLRTRRQIRAAGWKGGRLAWSELCAGRYRRFGFGLSSAVVDLARLRSADS